MLKRLRSTVADDSLGWIGLALVLIAAIALDNDRAPRKWDAAIVWTFAALFGLLLWGRNKRDTLMFWFFWAACLFLHVLMMWFIFGQLLPRLVLGTLFVMPLAFIESLFLFVIFSKLERRFSPGRARRSRVPNPSVGRHAR